MKALVFNPFFLKEEMKWRQVFLPTYLINGGIMDGDMVQG
jgi:hypothetical protein